MSEPDAPADVLVIDDEPSVRQILTRLLERQGHTAAAAADGREALEYLAGHGPPRVIFLDLHMPGMDGWEFLRVRRQRAEWLAVPVIVFSASAEPRGPDPRELDADGVLLKPFDLLKVLDAARRYCRDGA